MAAALQRILSAVAKLFLGIFVRGKVEVAPLPPLPAENPPPPSPTPTPTPTGTKPPPGKTGPQSAWWAGVVAESQPYGCTHFSWELHNPNHPECDFWHDGIDYALPCGTPLFAGGTYVVVAVDSPTWVEQFGTAALGLREQTPTGPGTHQVWLLHMNDYAVKYGDLVRKGDLLGHSGTRGRSTGCHLHFMVTPRNGGYFSSVDPTPWLFPQS